METVVALEGQLRRTKSYAARSTHSGWATQRQCRKVVQFLRVDYLCITTSTAPYHCFAYCFNMFIYRSDMVSTQHYSKNVVKYSIFSPPLNVCKGFLIKIQINLVLLNSRSPRGDWTLQWPIFDLSLYFLVGLICTI